MGEPLNSQFQAMYDGFARRGVFIEVAYALNGRADYVYEVGRLLARTDAVSLVRRVLPWAEEAEMQPDASTLRVLSIENRSDGVQVTVPQALDMIDVELGDRNPARQGGFSPVTAVNVVHLSGNGVQPDTARNCPATEPEVPCCCAPDDQCGPCPPVAPDGGAGVLIGVCDTGLLDNITAAGWLNGVTGEADQLGMQLPSGLFDIPRYCGHGTFIAGVARCEAPEATVYVSNDYTNGGVQEWLLVQKLSELLARDPAPQVVNLSAGTYTRNDWPLLSFSEFETGGVTLVCAAGNDGAYRKFWPAAFDWAVAVGALGADQRSRAWFSNYGDWVDAYALGEGLVNAFAAGQYTYKEPPKRPATQLFDGRARWSGTSFATPLVAGLIAAEMSQAGLTAAGATQAVLARARSQAIAGVGPVLFPR